MLIDYDECIFADVYTDGEIVIKFQDKSFVPHKHKCGGQSAARFSRIRQECIKQWFKDINDKLKPIKDDCVIGMNSMYRSTLKKYLSKENIAKIKGWESTEYCNLSGVYQMVSKLEKSNL